MGLTFRNQLRATREELRSLSPAQRRAATRSRGPAPADPAARAVALNQARRTLHVLRRQRRWAPILFGVLLALAVVQAVGDSPWWWFAVALWAVALTSHLLSIRQLERRIAELAAAPVR